ncbi:MAG: hypothetical protein E6K56_03350 [Ignavibacteria bacterium]|nr:MAG: hypothetical protein E6K56_03350 [Ignavibacteria bacterium]
MSDAASWIVMDTLELQNKFNRKSFEIAHHLSSHPLLQLPKLMELAERTLRIRPQDLHYDAGSIRVEQRWDEIPSAPFSPQEALERIENSGAWVLFRSVQRDAEYRVLLDHGLA